MSRLTLGRIDPATSEIGIRAIRRVIVHASTLKASQLRSGDVIALSEADDGKTKKVRTTLHVFSLSQLVRLCRRVFNNFKLYLTTGFCSRDIVAFSGYSSGW
jgi:hypothetical protein